MAKQTSMLQLRLTDDEHQWFKKFCADRGLTMKSVLIEYIRYLRQTCGKEEAVKPL